MKYFEKVWLTCSRKRFIMAVEAKGKINEIICPCAGATAAEAYTSSRTTCAGACGRTPAGAQQRLARLMRPKQPSSCAMIKTGRSSDASRVATASSTCAGNFFCSAPELAGRFADVEAQASVYASHDGRGADRRYSHR